MRKIFVALFFGIFLGAMTLPIMDAASLYRTYGADTGVVFNELECLSIGMTIVPEVNLAKTMGLSKRQYMNYVLAATNSANSKPALKPRLDMIMFYIDRIWHSTDGGAAVIDDCFKRAAQVAMPKIGV